MGGAGSVVGGAGSVDGGAGSVVGGVGSVVGGTGSVVGGTDSVAVGSDTVLEGSGSVDWGRVGSVVGAVVIWACSVSGLVSTGISAAQPNSKRVQSKIAIMDFNVFTS